MRKDEIANALLTGSHARYKGSEYELLHFVLYFHKKDKKLKYSAVLLDKNGNSQMQVPIEQVEVVR